MDILTVTYPLNGLLMVALPLALGIYLTNRFQLSWRLFWIGAGTFIFSQVFHIPFNYLLRLLIQRGILPSPLMPQASLVFNSILFGLSAGVFEEVSRYLAYRWWARNARTWSSGLLLGAGHGGAEAIFLGFYVLYIFIQMVALRGADLTKWMQASQVALAQQQIIAYWSNPWYVSLLGAVERLFALVTHLAFSVIVLQAFTRNQLRWLWLAVLWHAAIDAFGAGYASATWGPFVTEGLIGVFALISLGIILVLRTPEPAKTGEGSQDPLPPIKPLPSGPESVQDIDRTRFQ